MFRPIAGMIAATAITLAAMPVLAQETEEAKVIATVDGSPITDRDIAYASEFLGTRLNQVPEQYRGRVILDILIDRKLFASAGRDAGVEDHALYDERLGFLTEEAQRDIYIEQMMIDDIGDDAVKARYEEEIAKIPETEELRARHILVKTEDEAKAIAEDVRGGADFAEVAKEKSTGPTGPNGGDLGYFSAQQMVPEFSAAAAALEVGAISDPVKTQFGWHVIKLEDKRAKPAPEFATVEEAVRRMVLSDKVKEESSAMREDATIEYSEGYEPPAAPAAPAAPAGEAESAN